EREPEIVPGLENDPLFETEPLTVECVRFEALGRVSVQVVAVELVEVPVAAREELNRLRQRRLGSILDEAPRIDLVRPRVADHGFVLAARKRLVVGVIKPLECEPLPPDPALDGAGVEAVGIPRMAGLGLARYRELREEIVAPGAVSARH